MVQDECVGLKSAFFRKNVDYSLPDDVQSYKHLCTTQCNKRHEDTNDTDTILLPSKPLNITDIKYSH